MQQLTTTNHIRLQKKKDNLVCIHYTDVEANISSHKTIYPHINIINSIII